MRKPLVTSVIGLLVLAALLCVPARADEPSTKPLAVVSCAGYDAMLADLSSALSGSHLPLHSALELEAANMVPVMQSESTRRGVEDFQQGKRFWFT